MDPIIIAQNCKLDDLRNDLQELISEAYDGARSEDHFQISLTREPNDSYILAFPHGVTFADFLWVVNFLQYPFEKHEEQTIARGYWEIPLNEQRFPDDVRGKLCEFYSTGESEKDAFTIHVLPEQGGHYILVNYTKERTRARQSDDRVQFNPPPDLHAKSFPIETFDRPTIPTPEDNSKRAPTYRLASRIYFLLMAGVCVVAFPFAGRQYDVISMIAAISFVSFCEMFHEQIQLPGVWREWVAASFVLFVLTLPIFPKPTGATAAITFNLRLFRVPLAGVIVASAIKHRLPQGRVLSPIVDRAIWGPLYLLATLILGVLFCLI